MLLPAPAPGAHRLTSELGVERIRLVAGGLADPVRADLEMSGAREIATDRQFAAVRRCPPSGRSWRDSSARREQA